MMTEKDLFKRGYVLVRGEYQQSCDDRADRWYIERSDASVIDRRGPGFRTKREALESFELRAG